MPLILVAPYRVRTVSQLLRSLWAWGNDNSGQSGKGSTEQNTSPFQSGIATDWKVISCMVVHTAAIKNDGTLWAWGDNSSGQLGQGDTLNRYSPTQIGTDTDWGQVSCCNYFVLAIKNDGTLWAWGNNGDGQLGKGHNINSPSNRSPVKIGTDTNWSQVDGGDGHTAAIKVDGTLWAWGNNGNGQLGKGDTTQSSANYSPVKIGTATDWKSVSCGYSVTAAIKNNGTLLTCGWNSYGQLGKGNNTDSAANYSLAVIGSGYKSISWGQTHVLAIKTDDAVWAWGNNGSGQLGKGNTNDNASNYSPVKIGTATDWKSVSCGDGHTAAIKNDGTLWTWGWNGNGRLGKGNYNDNASNYSPAQIGIETNWISVGCGQAHTLALRAA